MFIFIAGGCHTAEDPVTRDSIPETLKKAGVDIVMAWDKGQNKNRYLFVKYFLTKCFEQEADGSYLNINTALVETRTWLVLVGMSKENIDKIIKNLKWNGTIADPLEQRLMPARYGQDDIQ